MSETALIDALLLKKPYFGSALRALQGSAERHRYMGAVIRYLTENRQTEKLNILEVGSWAGASAVTWAKSLKSNSLDGHVMCIDPWEPFIDVSNNADRHYLEMESSLEQGTIFELFLHNLKTTGVDDIVQYQRGRSDDVMPGLVKGLYSIVYVDGAHHYQGVLTDLIHAADLIPDGGIICGDDLELQMGQVDQADLSNDVDQGLDYTLDARSGIHYHPGVTRAVGETFGEVGEWQGFWAIQKKDGQWIIPDISSLITALPDHLVPFATTLSDDQTLCLDSYNVFRFQDKFIAISKNIGTIDPMERVGNTEIFPLILVSDTRDGLLEKVEKAEATGLGAHLELVEQSEHYNYIRMGKRMFAVSTSLGPVDLKAAIGTVHMPPLVLQGETEADVRDSVKHYSEMKNKAQK